MAAKIPWKSLSKKNSFFSKWGPISTKWGTFSAKQLAFFAAAGLVLVGGLVVRSGLFSGEPDAAQKAPVTIPAPTSPDATRPAPSAETTPAPTATAPAVAPAEPVTQPPQPAPQAAPAPETATAPSQQPEQTGEPVEQAGQPELPDPGTILVSRQPVEVLSGPSASASVMYGFPAGRRFSVIGREGGFAQIKDVESGASGWINEAALAPPPRAPDVYAPSQSRRAVTGSPARASADPKPKATKRDSQAGAGSETAAEPAQTRKRPGLFGGDGPFRGIFGGN